MDVTKAILNEDFAQHAAPIYDKIIIGGGMAGLQSAYEILRAAKKVGKNIKVAVVADTINSPALAGSNVVMGLDGFEDSKKYTSARSYTNEEKSVLKQIRLAATHVGAIVWKEKIDCRFSMGYQFLGSDTINKKTREVTSGAKNVKAAADWLVNTFGYKDSIKFIDPDQIKFKGFNSVMRSDDIGQINAPEFQQGLVEAVRRMGGTVITGVNYQSHEKTAAGEIAVHTGRGTLMTATPPLLATGAGHVKSLEQGQLPIKFNQFYTGAIHIQLTPEDVKKVSSDGKPMAYCDTNLVGDIIWGSLDGKGVLTMGFGNSKQWAGKKNQKELRNKLRETLPEIAGKYLDGALRGNVTYSYGPMLKAKNLFPLVGRMSNYDVMVGWASRGIVQSSAAAQAYANYVVNGDAKDLRAWESLQPRCFRQQQALQENRPRATAHAGQNF